VILASLKKKFGSYPFQFYDFVVLWYISTYGKQGSDNELFGV